MKSSSGKLLSLFCDLLEKVEVKVCVCVCVRVRVRVRLIVDLNGKASFFAPHSIAGVIKW